MSEAATLAAPVTNRCNIEEVFDAGFIELVRLVPRNPHVRALILKFTGKMPGPECASFEQLKGWVETNCKPRPFAKSRDVSEGGILIQVDFSETEYGRADYSVRSSGRDQFRVGEEDLIEMVEEAVEAGDGIDEVVERISQTIEEDAWSQCEPNMEDYGEYDYSAHDMTGTDDTATDYSKSDIRQAVLLFLRERRADLAAELQ